jgi:hypothetical protein
VAGVVSDCVIAGNQAVNGGGVHGATLYDCLIRGNVAQKGGGGVYGSSLHRCRLIGNQAGGSGASDDLCSRSLSEARYVQDGGGGAYASALILVPAGGEHRQRRRRGDPLHFAQLHPGRKPGAGV